MVCCRFGRQATTIGYREVCRSAFNNTLIAAFLQSAAIESLLKIVGLTSQGLPSPLQMFIFGTFAGGARGALTVVVDKIFAENKFEILNIKEKHEKAYHVARFVITFFASLKTAEYMCHDFKVPVELTHSVVLMQVADYGLGVGVDILFNPAPRAGE